MASIESDNSSTEGELVELKEKLRTFQAEEQEYLQDAKFKSCGTSSDESCTGSEEDERESSKHALDCSIDNFDDVDVHASNKSSMPTLAKVPTFAPLSRHTPSCTAIQPKEPSIMRIWSDKRQEIRHIPHVSNKVDVESPEKAMPITNSATESCTTLSSSTSSSLSSGSSSETSSMSEESSVTDQDAQITCDVVDPIAARMVANPYVSARGVVNKTPHQSLVTKGQSTLALQPEPGPERAPRCKVIAFDPDNYIASLGGNSGDDQKQRKSHKFSQQAKVGQPQTMPKTLNGTTHPSLSLLHLDVKREQSDLTNDASTLFEHLSVDDGAHGLIPKAQVPGSTNDRKGMDATLPFYEEKVPECDQKPEIDFRLYSPPQYKPRKPPVLHKFNQTNRPKASRIQIPVLDLFQAPVSILWQGRFEKFNALQSELSKPICYSDDHIVVSAPTGAGKTVIFEMAMARFMMVDLQDHGAKRVSKNRKMVYIAPSKAICEERYQDWTQRLAALNLGIEVTKITGDTIDPGACYHDLSSANLVLTTPEKWDSISRKWTENFFLLASVKLLMIDEVHLLGDASRGHSLEAIIARTKSIHRAALNINASQSQIKTSR